MPLAVLPEQARIITMPVTLDLKVSAVYQPQAIVQNLTQAVVAQILLVWEIIKWDFPVLARHLKRVAVTQQILILQRRTVLLGFFVATVLRALQREQLRRAFASVKARTILVSGRLSTNQAPVEPCQPQALRSVVS